MCSKSITFYSWPTIIFNILARTYICTCAYIYADLLFIFVAGCGEMTAATFLFLPSIYEYVYTYVVYTRQLLRIPRL